jgi:DNA-binding NarL/FixJ family response regulator
LVFLGQPSASIKALPGLGRERIGLALEFSKPAQLVTKRADNETGRLVRGHTTEAAAIVNDDPDAVRTGLARLFAADAQFRVVSTEEIGVDTVERILRLTPDAVLVDVWVPAGSAGDGERPTNEDSPVFNVVVLASAFGYETARALGRRPEVSKRELSILKHVATGQSNKQIAQLLGISAQTVRNHMSRIFHKLGVSNRTEAVMSAVRLGLLMI